MGISSCNNLVSFNSSISNLCKQTHSSFLNSNFFHQDWSHLSNDVSVSEAHYDPVLWGIVLVFVLYDKTLAGIVVRLSFSSALEFDLVALEVRSVLYYLHKRLRGKIQRPEKIVTHTRKNLYIYIGCKLVYHCSGL